MNFRQLLATAVLPVIAGVTQAGAQKISFTNFSTDDGLSDNTAKTMYQDERGMIWIGTRNGLNQYNGNGFTQYGSEINIDYQIQEITGDGQGRLFIRGGGVLSSYDIDTETFDTISEREVSAIWFNDGLLYAGCDNTVCICSDGIFRTIIELPDKDAVVSVIGTDGEELLVGTINHGLYIFDKDKNISRPIRSGRVAAIYQDKDAKWWIGTYEDGIYIIEDGEISNIRHNGTEEGPSSNFVRCFTEDREGNMWIGTFNGVNVYDRDEGSFTCYYDRNSRTGTSSVWSLLCDSQGSMWVGTYADGIYRYNPEQDRFLHWKREPEGGLGSSVINVFAQDDEGGLWIGTDGGGLNRMDLIDGSIRKYVHENGRNSISRNNVIALYHESPQKVLWLATHLGGLDRFDLRTGRFSNYRHDPEDENSIMSNGVRAISSCKDGLFIATDIGVCRFSPSTGKFQTMFSEGKDRIGFASGIFTDSNGLVWIYGGTYGVYSYDPETEKLTNYTTGQAGPHSLLSNVINSVYEDSKGRLWFCGNNGISLYSQDTDDFIRIGSTGNGLASDFIYNAAELPSGDLLFTFSTGFAIFHEDSGTFTNYDNKNGIPLNTINKKALYVTDDGTIFIGSQDGMISFREEALGYSPEGHRIFPYRLVVQGHRIIPGGADGILSHALYDTREIVLKPDQTLFSIEYVTSDYISDDEKNLEFFMTGLSTDWTSMEGRPTVSFSSLSPGKYTLKVRPRNNWSQAASCSIDITVPPPFYLTWWAFLLYFTIGGTITWFVIREYRSHVHLVERLSYERERSENVEELNKSKIRFFTNISHEFRTPLTLISGNAEMLMQVNSLAPTVYNKVVGIYKNSKVMQTLITELLDFSKLENSHMKIKASEHNIVEFVYENYLLFKDYATHKGIGFDFIKTDDRISLWYDPKQMQKVMNNLISNAFKHTPKGGKISVIVRRDKDSAVIEVRDNGAGIPEKDLGKIFDRFYQSEYQQSSVYTGTGIGLSLTKGIVELHHGTIEAYSKPGDGATFRVIMKTGREHFCDEEIDTGDENLAVCSKAEDLLEIEEMNTVPQETVVKDNRKSPKIVIAEDNESMKELLAGIFSSRYEVIIASDGKEAWKKVREEMPDIVLSDVVMPEMSGIDLCRTIKHDLNTSHIPVVLLTARTTVQQNLEGLYSSADDYISKPFNVNILLARCNNLVNSRTLIREKFGRQTGLQAAAPLADQTEKEFVDKAAKIINSHISDENFSVDTLAREMFIARTKLFSKIKSLTGQTPRDFINTVRMKYAASLLMEHPELNIAEIADRLGFSSPRQFSKIFKEKYNMTPQEYRKVI